MHRYVKGARSERELLAKLWEMGFSVSRSAGSGVNSLGPDLIAIRKRRCISIECKAWERNRLSLDKEGYKKLKDWEENTSFPTYVGWRMNGMGWHFVKLDEFKEGPTDYSITKKRTLEIGRGLESITATETQAPKINQIVA